MKRIRQKILVPFITIILIIPITTMILFNIVMNIYTDQTAKEELTSTVEQIDVLIRRKILNTYLNKEERDTNDIISNNLSTLRAAINLSKIASNTEFYVLSTEDNVIYPIKSRNRIISDKVFERALDELVNSQENTIIEFSYGGTKYLSTHKTFEGKARSVRLLYISLGNSADDIISIINLILLGILLFSVVTSIMIALSVSKSISTPITRLTDYARRIGKGEFLSLMIDDSSLEMHDLTKSMNDMSNRLKNYDHAQKTFLQNASHELRTPLMSIQGYAEGIVNGVFSDTINTANIICDESRRLNSLVEELLTLSRIDNQTYKEELTSLNISDMIKEYIQKIEGYALKEGKIIHLDIKEEKLYATIDDTLLLQAVINILSNCIKYAEKEVWVTVFSQNNHSVIRISDDGKGITKQDLPYIFERFYKGKKGSFGLGLSIAKSAVEYMGGTIVAYNGPKGATFDINLYL